MQGVHILRFASPLLFTNVEQFKELAMNAVQAEPVGQRLVIDCSAIAFIDSMGVCVLHEVFDSLTAQGTTVLFAEVSAPVRKRMERAGFSEKALEENLHPSLSSAVTHATVVV